MTESPTPVRLRLLAAIVAGLLLLALVVVVTRDRNPVDAEPAATETEGLAPTDEDQTNHGASTTVAPIDLSLLEDPAEAEAAGADAVLAAGRHVAMVDWLELTDPRWRDHLDILRPVYVGRLVISEQTKVEGDLVIAIPAGSDSPTTLRWLAGSSPLRRAGSVMTIEVARDGLPLDVTTEVDAAIVSIPNASPDAASLLRVRFKYTVPNKALITDDGGPAGFGILARSPGVTMLGHGFPVLTYDPAPMVTWGDVGAFPVAIWSILVEAEGTVATGASETACPAAPDCVWARGTTLRDVAIALFDDDAVTQSGEAVDGSTVRVTGTSSLGDASAAQLLAESIGSVESLSRRLGPLPWRDVEVVLAPLTSAAGMEFPGLVILDPEYLDRLNGGFGTFVVAHEAGHQWFHALVGNSSLSEAVVDESLAQYVSLWYYRDAFGDPAAQAIVDRYLEGRYDRARDNGIKDVAPSNPLSAFDGDRTYGPMTYARAPFAWVVADGQVGESAIVAFLAAVVEEFGLGEATAVDLQGFASQQGAMEVVRAIERWWIDPTPAHDEVP